MVRMAVLFLFLPDAFSRGYAGFFHVEMEHGLLQNYFQFQILLSCRLWFAF